MILNSDATMCINILALIILDHMILQSNVTSKRSRRYFHVAIWAIIVVIAAEIAAMYFESADDSYRVFHILSNVIGFAVSPFIPMFIGCAITKARYKCSALCWLPAVMCAVFSVLSCRFPIIFTITAAGAYSRGTFFWIYPTAYGVSMIYLLIETIRATAHYQSSRRHMLYVLFLFVVLGTSAQIAAPQLHVSWLCISFAIGLYYTFYCEISRQLDGLTSLLNRSVYENYLAGLNGKRNAVILFFDIDNFKVVNDKYGHQVGDICISSVSSCLKRVFFNMGLCFRIGGDEFCVICDKAEPSEIGAAYRKFLSEIELMRSKEERLPMVSIGCARYDCSKGSIEDAVREADKRMYHFKQKRKNASVDILKSNVS